MGNLSDVLLRSLSRVGQPVECGRLVSDQVRGEEKGEGLGLTSWLPSLWYSLALRTGRHLRYRAVNALVKLDPRRARDPLLACLQDPDDGIRGYAMKELEEG